MMGIFVLILLGLWGWFAVWLGKLLSRTVFARFTTNTATGEATKKASLITLLLIACVLLLPVLDQLIAYPKWQQLCATTGDFEWGPGMDEEKAFGREVVYVSKRVTTKTIFPNIKIDYTGFYIYDAKTQELIFKKPHYRYSAKGFFYLPSSSGNKSAMFLPTCKDYKYMTKSDDLIKRLELKQLEYKGVLK